MWERCERVERVRAKEKIGRVVSRGKGEEIGQRLGGDLVSLRTYHKWRTLKACRIYQRIRSV